jgi:hypothetical protein
MRLGPALLLVGLAVLSGCSSGDRPRIAVGTRCANCGMATTDLRFACARRVAGRWLTYDSIECLIQGGARDGVGPCWLADYDARVLRPADSLWVVRGQFPSPMGGGFAAFTSREAAESIAGETHGRVDRFAGWAAKGWP